MQKSSRESNLQDLESGEPVALATHAMDKLALTWSIGIGIGYAFLVSFICWIGYRCFLVYNAYRAGDFSFIVTELKTDLLISAAYFGIAIILRKKGYI
jgi:hypothetical protein